MITENNCENRLPAGAAGGKLQQPSARVRHVATAGTRPTHYGFFAPLAVHALLALPLLILAVAFFAPTALTAAPRTHTTFIAAAPNTDIFSTLYTSFVDFAANMSAATHSTFVRAAFMLIFQTIITGAVFKHSGQSMPRGVLMAVQWAVCFVLVLLLVQLPLETVPYTRAAQGFTLAVSLFALAVLPWRLSWFLCPREGQRRIVAVTIYALLGLLITIQLMR